ncbi:MAG: hypothetical protein IPJ13_24410 [Saprospiraceae bacterium]|nr:hypothetical protein [Saprospiraceae bacterium]
MLIPLYILAALSIVAGIMNAPEIFHGNKWLENFIAPVTVLSGIHLDHATEWFLCPFRFVYCDGGCFCVTSL